MFKAKLESAGSCEVISTEFFAAQVPNCALTFPGGDRFPGSTFISVNNINFIWIEMMWWACNIISRQSQNDRSTFYAKNPNKKGTVVWAVRWINCRLNIWRFFSNDEHYVKLWREFRILFDSQLVCHWGWIDSFDYENCFKLHHDTNSCNDLSMLGASFR